MKRGFQRQDKFILADVVSVLIDKIQANNLPKY